MFKIHSTYSLKSIELIHSRSRYTIFTQGQGGSPSPYGVVGCRAGVDDDGGRVWWRRPSGADNQTGRQPQAKARARQHRATKAPDGMGPAATRRRVLRASAGIGEGGS
jgi:hypothetical protein